MDYQYVGAAIRAARRTRGLTIERLAELADVSPSFLGNVERGARVPSLQTMVNVSRALRVSVDALLPPAEQPAEPASLEALDSARQLLSTALLLAGRH